ncbi:MAG: polysaccharide biosynthesis/export family protein [Planctomycetaceae bacterium]|nr:polysaccharide biosynthesis/export family protein [Planctomycetaceae bacterium]
MRDQPKELAKMPLPAYYIESPDIVTVRSINIIPKPPYLIKSMDQLFIDVAGTPDGEEINGLFLVQPGGEIELGVSYGKVQVGGMSIEDAERMILSELKKKLKNPRVQARVAVMGDLENIDGNKLVEPDGYITIGSYGRVYVNGLTLEECRDAIELHLSKQLEHPIVSVEMFAYNSKEYYVILQGAGPDQVISFPYTGNETVLKAIANVNGLQPFSSRRMWIARPIGNTNKPLILPVDWNAIVAYGAPQTNYQIIPGDRVFVQVDNWVVFDQRLAKIFAPFERVMGFMLLNQSVLSRYSGNVMQNGRSGYGGY